VDAIDFQDAKLRMMPTGQERELALMLWRAQAEVKRAEEAMEAYYAPLVHACSTPEELQKIMPRMPDAVFKVFVCDYLKYGRDWSKTHEASEAARIAANEARKAAQ
jgi:hypothetical protein